MSLSFRILSASFGRILEHACLSFLAAGFALLPLVIISSTFPLALDMNKWDGRKQGGLSQKWQTITPGGTCFFVRAYESLCTLSASPSTTILPYPSLSLPLGHSTHGDERKIIDRDVFSENRRKNSRDLYPCSLINFKVVPQVPPLKYRYGSVGDAGDKRSSLQPVLFEKDSFELPPQYYSHKTPWKALAAGLFGVVGICWGWGNRRHPTFGGAMLILGCLLWGCACFVLLPWSVTL